MTTLYLEWNGDLVLECRTSIQTAVGWDEARQRIIRRIITSGAQQLPDGTFTAADYVFDPSYGVGAGKMVGQPFNDDFVAQLRRRIQAGVLADAAVDTTIPPSIRVTRPNPNTVWAIVGVQLSSGDRGEIQLKVTH